MSNHPYCGGDMATPHCSVCGKCVSPQELDPCAAAKAAKNAAANEFNTVKKLYKASMQEFKDAKADMLCQCKGKCMKTVATEERMDDDTLERAGDDLEREEEALEQEISVMQKKGKKSQECIDATQLMKDKKGEFKSQKTTFKASKKSFNKAKKLVAKKCK
jgi:hypothetical protein